MESFSDYQRALYEFSPHNRTPPESDEELPRAKGDAHHNHGALIGNGCQERRLNK